MTGVHNHPSHTEKIKKLAGRPYVNPSETPNEQLVQHVEEEEEGVVCLVKNEFNA